uniref:Pc21g00130 putative n=1 Tax=Albugo laibachii Nc14 TaxID=890382 RepID=F0WRY4_9STRA|nr:Pc21g00130 putative [Albugo laibachii Nc14]|eukprot:CCA24101.1 Pc21g00130 putative [Albugo laibachii Nc14]
MTIWIVYKKQFVKAWTLKHPHFGNKSPSRAEGAHAYVKKFLQVSTGALLLVFNKLNTALDHQIKAEVSQRSMEKMHHLVKIPEIFASVSGKISLFALRKCLVQHGKLKQELHPCTGIFTLEMGIPCTYKLAAIIRNRGTLTAYNFHPQWQLKWNSTNGEKKDFGGQWELIRSRIEMLPATKQ